MEEITPHFVIRYIEDELNQLGFDTLFKVDDDTRSDLFVSYKGALLGCIFRHTTLNKEIVEVYKCGAWPTKCVGIASIEDYDLGNPNGDKRLTEIVGILLDKSIDRAGCEWIITQIQQRPAIDRAL